MAGRDKNNGEYETDLSPVPDLNAEAIEEVEGNQKALLKAQQELQKLHQRIVWNALSSDAGQELLQWMVEQWDDVECFNANNTHQTSFNEGARFVVRSLRTLYQQAEKGG